LQQLQVVVNNQRGHFNGAAAFINLGLFLGFEARRKIIVKRLVSLP